MASFRIRATFGKNWRFDHPEYILQLGGLEKIHVVSADRRFRLNDEELWKRDDIETVYVYFISHGYESIDTASNAAKKVQHAIAVLGFRNGGPTDPGFLSLLGQNGPNTVEIIESGEFSTGSYSGGPRQFSVTQESLLADMQFGVEQFPLSEKKLRGLAILANQQFPSGLRCSLDDGLAKLIARVSAIEALSSTSCRSKAVQGCIDQLIKIIASSDEITDLERDQLKSGLSNLRNESISQSCRNLISSQIDPSLIPAPAGEVAHLVESPERQFSRAYQYRSSFLHAGQHSEGNAIDLESHDLVRQVGLDLESMLELLMNEGQPD